MKIRIKDIFSPARWKSVSIFLLRKLINKLEGSNDATKFEEVHLIEQYMFRILKCTNCVKQGSCTHCGCAIPAKMWVRSDHCSLGKWGSFMTKKEWYDYKKKFNISFKLSINDKFYSADN